MRTLPLSSIPYFVFFQIPKCQVRCFFLLRSLKDIVTGKQLYYAVQDEWFFFFKGSGYTHIFAQGYLKTLGLWNLNCPTPNSVIKMCLKSIIFGFQRTAISSSSWPLAQLLLSPKLKKCNWQKASNFLFFTAFQWIDAVHMKYFCLLKKDFGVYVQQNLRAITHKTCPIWHMVKYDFLCNF